MLSEGRNPWWPSSAVLWPSSLGCLLGLIHSSLPWTVIKTPPEVVLRNATEACLCKPNTVLRHIPFGQPWKASKDWGIRTLHMSNKDINSNSGIISWPWFPLRFPTTWGKMFPDGCEPACFLCLPLQHWLKKSTSRESCHDAEVNPYQFMP